METPTSVKILLALTGFIAFVQPVSATHLRAGDITVERIGCGTTFNITITIYIDSESGIRFGGEGAWLYFGDGDSIALPEKETIPRPDLGQFMGTVSFSTLHIYSSPGSYRIVYIEPNRNDKVLNIPGSIDVLFSISTFLNLEPTAGCNEHTPILSVPPIDRACTGVAFFHNPGAYDVDGDSLSYELAVPSSQINAEVMGYADPNDPKFYTNYAAANEDHTGPPEFSIDPLHGTLVWNAPGAQGEYNIAFKVNEWRKNRVTGAWDLLSFVIRDMQITVSDCNNERPDIFIPNDTCIVAGTILKADILGIDRDKDPVKIEAFSSIFALAKSPAAYSPYPPVFQPSNPTPARVSFTWNTTCDHIRQQPYQVVFKITDNPPAGPKLVTFKTWNVTVVAPPPVLSSAVINASSNGIMINWQPYDCQNAETIQVWRRIGSADYMPAHCETGMPAFLGYELITSIPASQTSYLDSYNLVAGVSYCYRLVAVFPLPAGGQSYISNEQCTEPIPAEAPLITHVTVERTRESDGAIRVSWRSPFSANNQFVKPYRYIVVRGNSYAASDNLLKVSEIIEDTTFLDIGMNTTEKVYNYRIVMLAKRSVNAPYEQADTSFTASSVRLNITPEESNVELNWAAFVPWTNRSNQYPWHYIYRGPEGVSDSELATLIDSVNVNVQGFSYTDKGNYQNTPLEKDKMYCYRIVTSGSYGNNAPGEPLRNFSQTICTYPDSEKGPCKPTLFVKLTDCQLFYQTASCDTKDLTNTIYWSRDSQTDCRSDIREYRIYVSFDQNGIFTLAKQVADTFYLDRHLTSFAKCYRVSAVDFSGNESALSDPVCNDNCPYYELPNIFTPNGDGCNDVFSAYYDDSVEGEETSGCTPAYPGKCARFVSSVTFNIYNRWGKQVYSYKSGSEKTTLIKWDGKDTMGKDLSSAVYYYVAEITFNVIDPEKKHRTLKGWVHLLK